MWAIVLNVVGKGLYIYMCRGRRRNKMRYIIGILVGVLMFTTIGVCESVVPDKPIDPLLEAFNELIEPIKPAVKVAPSANPCFLYLEGTIVPGTRDGLKTVLGDWCAVNGRPSAIVLMLNTPGGYIDEAIAIYDWLNMLKLGEDVPLYTVVTGQCASAGIIILQAGTKRYAHRHSFLMTHRSYMIFTVESTKEAIVINDEMLTILKASQERSNNRMIALVAERMGVSPKSIEWMFRENAGQIVFNTTLNRYIKYDEKDQWFDAIAAYQYGLIDAFIPTGVNFFTLQEK